MSRALSPPTRLDDVLFDVSHFALTGNVNEHRHSCIEIVLFVDGVATHVLDGARGNVYPGCVTIIHPGSEHAIFEPRGCELYNISCAVNLFQAMGVSLAFLKGREALFDSSQNSFTLNLSGLLFMDVRSLARHMFEIHQDKDAPERHARLRSLFSMLLILLAQAWEPKKPQGDHRLTRVLEYMEEHRHEKLSLENLARRAGMSKNQFLRKFRERFGDSPGQYLINSRLKRAATLLEDTSLTIDQIAASVGFYNSAYFIKLYKREFGITPGARRRLTLTAAAKS